MSFFSIGIGCGLTATALLLIVCATRWRRPNLSDGLVAFLSGVAVPGGIRLCILAPDIAGLDSSEKTFVFIGGIAVSWISVEAIWDLTARVFVQPTRAD